MDRGLAIRGLKLRPTFWPHGDCLAHWSDVPCLGCLYEAPEYRSVGGYSWWRIKQPFRAAYCRLFARFEYDPPSNRCTCCGAPKPQTSTVTAPPEPVEGSDLVRGRQS